MSKPLVARRYFPLKLETVLLTSGVQHDRMNVTAVVRLAPMHRAAGAVAALVGIGINADVVDHQDAGVFEPHPDESGKIEHRMAVALRGNEERGILRIGLYKTLDEFAADFVRVLADQGANRGDHAAAFGAELFHGVDG